MLVSSKNLLCGSKDRFNTLNTSEKPTFFFPLIKPQDPDSLGNWASSKSLKSLNCSPAKSFLTSLDLCLSPSRNRLSSDLLTTPFKSIGKIIAPFLPAYSNANFWRHYSGIFQLIISGSFRPKWLTRSPMSTFQPHLAQHKNPFF